MIIFIFPYFKVGGADKVHLEIIRSVNQDKRIFVLFSSTDSYKISDEFKKNATCFFVHTKFRKIICAIFLIVLTRIITITVFGCNSKYFYLLLPKISKKSIKIDLTHAFSYPDWGIENIAINYIPYIDKRIVINNRTLFDYENQYKNSGIDCNYLNRFQIIPNGIEIKNLDMSVIEDRFDNFKIGYVGRFAHEKRPEIFLSLSTALCQSGIKARMIVDEFKDIKSKYNMIEILEGITDTELIRKEFSEISVLIVPSLREGFPLVIMEAMELGIPVISTAVGSISEHLCDGENGFISPNIESSYFLNFCSEKIMLMKKNRYLYKKISTHAREYAIANFNIVNFHQAYKNLLVHE